jgi:hypothetical protein
MTFTMPSRRTLVTLTVGYTAGIVSAVVVGAVVLMVGRHADNPLRVHHDFSRSAEGPIERADSGQFWIPSANATPGAALEVISGRLSNTATADQTAAGYVSVALDSAVASMTATFTFDQGSTSGGAVGLLIRSDIPPPVPQAHFPFTSPAHLAVRPDIMEFGVANEGQIAIIGSQKFNPPLEFGKRYTTTVTMDYRDAVARVDGPDGKPYVYSDPRIQGNQGNIACFEVFSQRAATDDRAGFISVSAT